MIIPSQNQISEEDLEYIFSGKKKRIRNKIVTVLKYTLFFFIITFAIFILINFQAVSKKLYFWYQKDYKNNISDKSVNNAFDQSTAVSSVSDIPAFSDNHIFIPLIFVDAPISWLVPNTKSETDNALENGVIHIFGTATPGTVGNVFVTGHSSNYIWATGKYKSVFALLNKLSVGDLVYLKYRNQQYTYKVYEKSVIKPSNTSVLVQGQKSILTLMTCTPVGTSINRLIIKSNQIYPDPKSNVNLDSSQPADNLPEIR